MISGCPPVIPIYIFHLSPQMICERKCMLLGQLHPRVRLYVVCKGVIFPDRVAVIFYATLVASRASESTDDDGVVDTIDRPPP